MTAESMDVARLREELAVSRLQPPFRYQAFRPLFPHGRMEPPGFVASRRTDTPPVGTWRECPFMSGWEAMLG
jgi:hypothetical protein